MAIQNRRGIYSDFDPTKMVEGEFAVVQSGDPNTSDGKAVYIAPTTGTAERVALYKDLQQEVQAAITDATDEVIQEVTAGIIEGVAEDVTKAETAATNAETSAQNAEASAEEAQEVLENKADNNGYYPDLYAGNLSSTKKQTDSTPYLMRNTGGSLSRIGEREDDTLVGATVNVNQLVDKTRISASATASGITYTNNGDGSVTVSGTATATVGFDLVLFNVPAGHRLLLIVNTSTQGSWGSFIPLYDYNNVDYQTGSIGKNAFMETVTNQTVRLRTQVWSGQTVDFTICPLAIDLTAKFGSTIADYLYSLEQTTAGAGIAKLREWGFLTGGYIPYNPGMLESVEATAHKMVGFNQWDEEWEVYGVSGKIKSKNRIPVIEGATYYLNSPKGCTMYLFSDKTSANIGNITVSVHSTFSIPQGVHYISMYTDVNYGTTYNHDICINLSSDRNREYEPYSAHTYDLGTDTLRGLFKLDSNNNLYADGDTKTSDGTVTRKYGVVDLGTLNWTYVSDGFFYAYINDYRDTASGRVNVIPNAICSKYTAGTINNIYSGVDKTFSLGTSNNYANRVLICDSAYNNATAFKASLDSIMLVYELATPTTEQSTPFQNPQICDPDGTEEYVTSNGVPVGHVTEYDYDIKGLAEELIDVPDVPGSNGTYVLKATRSASGISYEWVSEA